MSILNDQYIVHNVKNATDATPQIIFTAPRHLRIRTVKYRYRVPAQGPAGFQLMALQSGEHVALGRPYYLNLGAPLHNAAGFYEVDKPVANEVVTIPERDRFGALLWRLGKQLRQGHSLGLYCSGTLTGLEDLDITIAFLPD